MDAMTLDIPGLRLVTFSRHTDERGYFERIYDRDCFLAAGLEDCSRYVSVSFNAAPRTLRGLHFQAAPHEETKLVRVLSGRIFDVAVDLRKGSPSRGRWLGVELSAENGRALYIPRGFAHGFLTLAADCTVHYQMAEPYVAAAVRGVRWDNPFIAIRWPAEPEVIGERDRSWPDVAM